MGIFLCYSKDNIKYSFSHGAGFVCSLPYVCMEDNKGDRYDSRDETIRIFYYVLRLWKF